MVIRYRGTSPKRRSCQGECPYPCIYVSFFGGGDDGAIDEVVNFNNAPFRTCSSWSARWSIFAFFCISSIRFLFWNPKNSSLHCFHSDMICPNWRVYVYDGCSPLRNYEPNYESCSDETCVRAS